MSKRLLPVLILAAAAGPALADDVASPTAETPAAVTASPAGSDNTVATIEPTPPPAVEPALAPAITPAPVVGVVDQAPTGELVFTKGTREMGISGGLMMSGKFRQLSIAPQIGWFFSDNMSLSAVVSLTNVEANEKSATTYGVIAEPAYHVAIGSTAAGFLGMGIGAAYIDTIGLGLAIVPRLGVKIRIGETGFLVPSLQYSYITRDQMTANDIDTSSLTSAMMMNLGYNRIW